jgi:type IV fimbrial biogenesis protein FimT
MRSTCATETRIDILTGASSAHRLACRRGASSSAGFTLVELMITLLVGAILLGIAVPSFRNFVQDSRLTTESNSLVYSLNLARSEAVKSDGSVEVCASTNGTSCGGLWASGWIVCTPSPDCTTVLQASAPIATGNTISEQISGATMLNFLSNGQTGQAYQFVFCDNRGVSVGRDVEIDLIGRIEAAQNAGQQVSGAALAGC